jgi:acyl carrier protein
MESAPEVQHLAQWLTERVAYSLEIPDEQIKPDVKLVECGLESVYALALCGDVEDELGIEVEPTLAWDYPTIDSLVALLIEKTAEAA